MHRLSRLIILAALVGSLSFAACTDPNDEPAIAASIEAFSGVPQVIAQGERVELRWRTTDGLVFELEERVGSVMPDATQAWTCVRESNNMVCTAPSIPSGDDEWTCDGETCRRPIENDADDYRPITVAPTAFPIGSLDVWPDATSTFRISAEGNSGVVAMAWVQVVITSEEQARIVYWTASRSPAIVGESVELHYRTEGCDQIDWSASPSLARGEVTEDDDNNAERGTFTWLAATETRDFYLGCHPTAEEENRDARIRSHITIPVIQMPDLCERIELFQVVPPGPVIPGTSVEVSWVARNATEITGSAEPLPEDGFYVGATSFEGSRTVTIEEETTFTISVEGECGGASVSHTVGIIEDCIPNCSGRECGNDGCGGSCGSCPEGSDCDPDGNCVSGG